MSHDLLETAVEILGKTYKIKCPQPETNSLQRAAEFLDEKMRTLRDTGGIMNVDRIAIITALNVVHQLLNVEYQKESHLQSINERLHNLQAKIERALAPELLQPAD